MAKETRREVFMVEAPDKFIAYQEGRIAADKGANAIRSYNNSIFHAITLYSSGAPLESVREKVKEAVSFLSDDASEVKAKFQLRLPEAYYQALWGLSLSMLFGDPSPQFVQRGAGQDAVFDHLLRLTGAIVAPIKDTLHAKPFQYLQNVLLAQDPKAFESAEAEIDAFLKSYYAGMGLTPWHDTHLRQDPAFFGYWSFELAAVVKALDISDQKFSDNIFYPRDLVHQRMFRTWLEGQQGEADRQEKALLDSPEALAEIQKLMGGFLDNKNLSKKSAASMDQHMATISNLFGLSEDSLKDDPEKMRTVFLQLLKTMAKVSDDALKTVKNPDDPKRAKLISSIKEMEAKLTKGSPAVQDLAKLIEDEGVDLQELDPKEKMEAAQARLELLGNAAAKISEDDETGLEKLFEGIAGMMDDFSGIMGYQNTAPKRDIEAEVGKELSDALDEANKKNMIQSDFDWTSLFNKDKNEN